MDTLTLVYLVNAVLLVVHEVDSGYQKEWKLFRIPGGAPIFILLHIPLVGLILFGLLETSNGTLLGYILSILVSCGGLFAFGIHTYFIRIGNSEFTSLVSQGVLYAILATSIVQLYLTLMG